MFHPFEDAEIYDKLKGKTTESMNIDKKPLSSAWKFKIIRSIALIFNKLKIK